MNNAEARLNYPKKYGLAEKECVEIEDRCTSGHMYYGFKKILCKACLIFY